MEIRSSNSDILIGARLRARRVSLQMSEEWLADFLKVPVALLLDFESGRVRISHLRLKAVATVLDVPERYFYKLDREPLETIEIAGNWVRPVDRWFADFVVPYERQYLWLAKRLMGEEEAARDLLHDVYAELLTGEAWRSTKKPHTWVMRALLTRGVDRIRRSKVVSMRALPDVETLEFATQSLDGFEAVSVREQVRAGLDAINAMPDMTRRVLLMRRLDGLSVKEIAHRLGLTVKGVDYHIARGAFLFNQAMVSAGLDGVDAFGIGGFGLSSGQRKIVRDAD